VDGSGNRADLAGKVALVTGGTRGLGRAIADRYAREGASVLIAGRTDASARDAAQQLSETTGGQVRHRACHVGRWNEVDELAEFAEREYGRVDVLVNNAGLSPPYENPASVDEAMWRKVLDVNLMGPFRLTAQLGSLMAACGGGSIINVSSVAALHPSPDVIPYAAAKAGLNAITVAFAHAFGPTVRVNAIVAGTFLTDVARSWDATAFERQARTFALRRGAAPHEITGAALFLASEASSYVTGALLRVDGGYLPAVPA
jgi:NAD(P)-dependent dehydrogenase (short-subunit alcohol dehydrogenase family)